MDKRELKGALIAAAWEENEGVYHVRLEDVFEIIDQLDEAENIPEFIKEYEKDYKGSWEHAIEFSKEMRKESEETEVNKMDKEKLIDLLDRQTFAYHEMQPESPEDYTEEYKKGYNEGLKFAIAYIDQLAEPKGVPEEEFERLFEDHQKLAHELDDMKLRYEPDKYVKMALERGQQLLKIQSERDEAEKELRELKDMHPEKVVVPEFVAEWIEEAKRNESWGIVGLINSFRNGIIQAPFKTRKYFDENQRNVILAYLDGYTVEEPLYRARLKVITDEFIASYLRTQSSDVEDRLKALEIGSKYIHEDYRHLSEFTEDELKRLNIWDSGQWEVEEVTQ